MNARALILAGAIITSALPGVVGAQARGDSLGAGWREQQGEAHQGVQQGNIPLAQVIETIRRMTPGRLLDAGLESGATYRVRWAATDGRRIDYLVDAKTGAVRVAGGG